MRMKHNQIKEYIECFVIKVLFTLILLPIIFTSVFSQEEVRQDTIKLSKIEMTDQTTVMDIRHRIQDDKIIINYDLMGRDINRPYNISLRAMIAPHLPLRTSGIYGYQPVRLSGDVGNGIRIGRGKQIVWDYKREIPGEISEDDVRFEISVQEYKAGAGFSASLLRSAALPGWGQLYDGSRTKGALFMVAAAGAGGFFYFAHTNYAKLNDEYNELVRLFSNESSYEEVERLKQEMRDHIPRINDAMSIRNMAIYIGVGLYAVNILDALIFHSRGRTTKLYAGTNRGIKIKPGFTYNEYGILAGVQIIF